MNVTISVKKPSTAVKGYLRGMFLEPDAGLFVGTINKNQLAEIISTLQLSGSLATIVSSSADNFGIRIRKIGIDKKSRRTIDSIDGLQLVKISPIKSIS